VGVVKQKACFRTVRSVDDSEHERGRQRRLLLPASMDSRPAASRRTAVRIQQSSGVRSEGSNAGVVRKITQMHREREEQVKKPDRKSEEGEQNKENADTKKKEIDSRRRGDVRAKQQIACN
jgi:hypothetical protein